MGYMSIRSFGTPRRLSYTHFFLFFFYRIWSTNLPISQIANNSIPPANNADDSFSNRIIAAYPSLKSSCSQLTILSLIFRQFLTWIFTMTIAAMIKIIVATEKTRIAGVTCIIHHPFHWSLIFVYRIYPPRTFY